MKLYRIKDARGNVIRSRESNGYYDERISAERAVKQLKNRFYFYPPHVIEETEVNWGVSD
jgi:hypothetical protein